MSAHSLATRLIAIGGAAALIGGLSACSAGGSADTGSSGGKTSISYLIDNGPATAVSAKALVKAFESANPDITVKTETRPQGTDGDNLVKTRLSTGDMDDVFNYNSGSLLQALHPDNTLTDLSGESWVKGLSKDFKATVSTDKGLYGAPWGTSYAGAVMYNKKVYEKLGLSVPTTWDEFIANSEKIKAAGIAPIIQTYGDTWTSQLFVLGDFANVTAQQSDWASKYTANKAKYSKEPALAAFTHQQEVFDKGLMNKDYASATNVSGLKMLAEGTGAQYPMITSVISNLQQSNPDQVNDIGVFPLPADNASDTRLTVWEPGAMYIPKSTTGAKADAAKKFVAFANSSQGCKIQADTTSPAGPFVTTACSLPSDVPALIKDEAKYIDDGKSGLALEFLSPIKGPNLEKICVQVGSGISSASEGAKLYDQDVTAQAQQLGIKGW